MSILSHVVVANQALHENTKVRGPGVEPRAKSSSTFALTLTPGPLTQIGGPRTIELGVGNALSHHHNNLHLKQNVAQRLVANDY